MKLTWLGGTALRIYLGGEIVVVDPESAPANVDQAELLAGAGRVVRLGEGDLIDPTGWRPKNPPRGMDPLPPLEVSRIGPGALLIAAAGESPLIVLGAGEAPRFGRWADGGVFVLNSGRESLVATATVLLDVGRPRLIAIAADEQTLDHAIAALSEHLDGVGLVSLEPGLALEV
jgi:hypothetical protein